MYFDADCGFCTECVRVLQVLDGGRRLRVVPLHRAPHERADAPPLAALRESMHVVDGQRWWVGGDAWLEIAARVPALWTLSLMRQVPLAPAIVDRVYALVAANRHRIGRVTRSRVCRIDWDA